MTRKGKCSLTGCEKGAASRGLCYAHYAQALATVASGETTWPELERLGFARAAGRPGPKSDFRLKLAAARARRRTTKTKAAQ